MSKEISQNICIGDRHPLNPGPEVKIIVADVRRHANDDLPTVDDTTEDPAPFNAEDNRPAINTPELQDLAQLVWKYFEKEIRETMIEVQEVIQAEQGKQTAQVNQRKQKRK